MLTFTAGNTGINPIRSSASAHDTLAVTRLGWGLFWELFSLPAGVLLFFSGVICFFAFNWQAMPLFAKFGLLAGAIILAAAIALHRGFDSASGGASLLLCALLVGPLMAVYGQAYQTGADAWELFVSWGGLLLVFALCARTAGLWFAAFAITSLALGLWIGQVGEPFFSSTYDESFWVKVFIWWFMAWLTLWELAAWLRQRHGFFSRSAFLDARWLPRILCVCLVATLTIAMTASLAEEFSSSGNPNTYYFLPEYALCFVIGWIWFRKIQPDLMPLSLGTFSLVAVIMTQTSLLFSDGILWYGIGTLFILAFLLLGLTVGAVYLIMRLKSTLPSDNENLPSRKREHRKKLQILRDFMRNMSLLTFAGRPRRADQGRPWYLQVLTGICITIVMLLFFSACGMFFAHDFDTLWPLITIIFLGLAWALFKKPSELTRQAAFVLGISAVVCAYIGNLVNTGFTFQQFNAPALITCIAGWFLIKSPLFRITMATTFFALLHQGLLSTLIPFLSQASHPKEIGTVLLLIPIFMLLILLFVWFVKSRSARRGEEKDAGGTMYSGLSSLPEQSGLKTAGKATPDSEKKPFLSEENLMPLRVGIVLSLLGHSLFAYMSNFMYHGTYTYMPRVSYFALFTGLVFLYALYRTLKEMRATSQTTALALGMGMLISLLSLWTPWLVLGLLAVLLARRNGYLPLLAVSIGFLVVSTSFYYYQLYSPLLYKSYSLLSAGAVLCLMGAMARIITRKAQKTGALPLPETVFASPVLWPQSGTTSTDWPEPDPVHPDAAPWRPAGGSNA